MPHSVFPSASNASPGSADVMTALRDRAESSLKSQDWEKCIDACRSLLEFEPRHHFAQEALATALLQTGQIDEAILAVSRLLEISPRDPMHRWRLATLLQMQGRHGESLREFERITQLDGNSSLASDVGSAIENLDRLQTQQILLMAAEQDSFRWQLERDPAQALEDSGFYLSENGYEILRQMIPGSEDEPDGQSPRYH